jgi:putative hydrolase of the HAD superfamily
MVGNSMRSDVIPPIIAGGWGVHVPHGITWEIEWADPPKEHPRFRAIADLGQLADLIGWIDGS